MDDFYLEKGLPKRAIGKVHRLPKANLKYGTIVKSILKGPDGITLADLSFNDGIISRTSGATSNRSTEFRSLNKKGRWRLVDQFRNEIQDWNDQYENVRVSATENQDRMARTIPLMKSTAGLATCTALHTVEPPSEDQGDAGQPVHRYAKRKYAFLHTLTDKPKPPKKAQHGRCRPNSQQDAAQVETEREPSPAQNSDAVHVMYDIWTPVDSANMQRMRYQRENYTRFSRRARAARTQQRANARYFESWEEDNPEAPFIDVLDDLIDAAVQDSLNDVTYTSQTAAVVSLADFLVPTKTANRNKRQRRSHSESICDDAFKCDSDWCLVDENDRELLLDLEDVSIISETANDNDEDDGDAVVVPHYVAPLTATRVFEMIEVSLYLYTNSLKTDRLALDFGSVYHECACLPRRVCIDISNAVANVLSVNRMWEPERMRTRILCIVEVLPKAFNDMDGIFDEDTTLCRVYLNGHFTDQISSLYLNTLNPAEAHSATDVVTAAAQLVGTLPLECFTLASPSTTRSTATAASNAFHEIPTCFLRVSSQSLTGDKASSMVMAQQYAPKLQRQLTAVECFTEWFSDYTHICGICFDPVGQQGIALAKCQHWFCNPCWNAHLRDGIRNGQAKLCCPELQCDVTVDYDVLCAFVPLPLCEVYATQLRDLYMQANADQWLWCPNKQCGRVVHKETTHDVPDVLACECGFVWRLKCNQKAHWPASCEEFRLYCEMINTKGGDLTTAQHKQRIKYVEVKPCPHCKTFMEKSGGGNFMFCRCGKAFCWNCLRPWGSNEENGTRNPHYQCYMTTFNFKMQKVELIDIHCHSTAMSEKWYQRCLDHHHALSVHEIARVQKRISNCTKSYKKIIVNPFHALGGFNASTLAEHMDAQTNLATFHQAFLRLYRQVHYFLEYTFVWRYFRRQTSCYKEMKRIEWLTDRLNFTLRHMENTLLAKDTVKVQRLLDSGFEQLDSLISHMVTVKRKDANKIPGKVV